MNDHIRFDREKGALYLLDQRLLPLAREYVACASCEDAIAAIKNMTVRGAPAIGATAAWACALALSQVKDGADWREKLEAKLDALAEARPTAVNLRWAVARMRKAGENCPDPARLLEIWFAEAERVQKEDEAACRAIGRHGASLINDGDTILTHCNAGALATAGYGTALGVIRAAWEQGKKIQVFADETRPLLQGARLTAWELREDGIPVTLVCDNACALLLSRGMVQLVITGADRIAANGDSANKIGTYGVALLARHFGVPFYIAAPLSTIDPEIAGGADIPIEERSAEEVLEICGQRIAPEGVKALNFAFDVTPADLISGIITETGILAPPYEPAIARLFAPKAGR